MCTRVAIYGTAANPPHRGHADAIAQLLEQADEVLYVPSVSHAFGKVMAPFEHRLAMARLFVAEHFPGNERVKVDDIERNLHKDNDTPVYSIDVLREIQRREPGKQPLLAVGPDNADPQTWSRFRAHDIIDREFGKVIVQERMPVRSTEVRTGIQERLHGAEDQGEAALRHWLETQVGKAVARYILDNDLYLQEGGCD